VFENILEGLRKDLVGLEFVYKSKYGGEVKGNVKGVSITHQHNADKETNRRMLVGLSKMSTKVQITEKDKIELTPDFRWSGWSFDIMVTSENGISYDMKKDNIYFINRDE
jgi:hypothetical protein